MANTVIQLKHSTTSGNTPVSLSNGELAINNFDGKLFYRDPSGTIQTIQRFTGPAGLNKEVQFNDSGTLGANSGLTFDKSTGNLSSGSVHSRTYFEFGDGTRQYSANVGTAGSGSALTVKDEGTTLNSAVTSIDFVGAGVVATNTGSAITVTIAGGSGSPGGSTTQVQFNDSGSFAGSANLTFDKTTNKLTNEGVASFGPIVETSLYANSSYTITTGKSAMSVGPLNIADGVSITVPSGSKWVIL